MKRLVLFLIRIYQVILSPFIHQIVGVAPGKGCRFEQSCSKYAARSIREYGILRGSLLAVRRILSCQSWSN
jgi:hypothetical protein